MWASKRLLQDVVVLVLLLCIGRASMSTTNKSSDKRAVIIKKAFKQLLKVNSLPSVSRNEHLTSTPPPPQYMLELYEKFNSKQDTKKFNGNTVRSIVAIRGNINGNQMLIFNLSGIHADEEMLFGELHFYKRRRIKWPSSGQQSLSECRIKVYDISSDDVRTLATLTVPRHSNGWQMHDVTRMVKECRKATNHLLGIKFEKLNKKSEFVSIPLNKFIRLNYQPFLIVFSNDRMNNTVNEFETHLNDEILIDDDITDFQESISSQDSVSSTKHNHSDNLQKSLPAVSLLKRFSRAVVDKNRIYEGDFGANSKRNSRSLFTNELPDNSVHSNYIPQTSPGILRSRGRQRPKQMSKLIPLPATMTFGKHRKKGERASWSSKKQRHNRKLPTSWQESHHLDAHHQPKHENDATAEVSVEEGVDSTLCQKRKLVVDFADIGWGEWIISPKSFEAHYCSGMCPFPLTKNMKPSNHATIQSIVHAIGIQANVPGPCCVADTMSSVTLLYFDEDRNVVLKNYPSMTVESCACR